MASIRKILPITLSIQIIVAVGITGWISFIGSESAVNKLIRQVCDNMNYRVEEQIYTHFRRSLRVNKALSTALTDGSVNPSDISQVQKDIFRKSKELITENNFFYGNQSGTQVSIQPILGTSKFELRIREDDNQVKRATYELNENGERGRLLNFSEVYDHRTRPWYIAAKQAGKATWSDVFVSTTDNALTITRATPIYNSSGGLQGVVGINISLKQIREFMRQSRPSDKWDIFLAENNGSLVATTDELPIFENSGKQTQRFKATDSKNRRLKDASLVLQSQFGGFQKLQNSQVIEFESNGEKYIVSTLRLESGIELDWTMGIIVPKSIFMQEIDANNRVTLIIIVVMLGVNILIGLVISTWLLRPIKNLTKAAKGIQEESFNPEELDSVARRKDELGQMAQVFQEMGNTITERQSGMKSQLSELREEKDKAKMTANDSQMGLNNWAQSIVSRSRAARNK